MRVVNRTAVIMTGAQPFIDWMRDTDADFNRGAITVPRAKACGSAFLLPETRDLQTFREWFRIDIHSVVDDVADDDIEGEEL